MSSVITRPANPSVPVRESLFRAAAASVDEDIVQVEESGGRFSSGIIRGVSLIATGEALGHEMWIDETTLAQVIEASSLGKHGVKSRFTHPSMSSDGMGRHLGRIHDVQLSDGRVVGDLHFAESAHNTPDGDLASYVMTLTKEDPNAAGLSIVFEHDQTAENQFMLEHGGIITESSFGDYEVIEGFQSPDPANIKNYPHVRLSKLRAADIVDEPAANPDGMFDRQSLARDADSFLSFAAGLTKAKPDQIMFGIDAERASQFFTRWLDSHGLSLVSKEELAEMAQSQTAEPTTATPEITRASLLAEQSRYVARFGAEDGVAWFTAGKDYTEALEAFSDQQAAKIEKLQAQLAESEAKFASIQLGEAEPVETVPGESVTKKTFASRIRVVGGPSHN